MDKVVETTKTLVNNPELLQVPGEKSAQTNFLGLMVTDKGPIRFFPKNWESFADSKLFPLLAFCCDRLGETPVNGEFDMSQDQFIDINDLASKCYWQGILKGLGMVMKGIAYTDHPKKDPFKNGIWYVQARVLNNLRLNQLCISIPKRQGIFDFTSRGRNGFTLAQTIVSAELINRTIDTLSANAELIRCCLLRPNDLKSQSKVRHKRPSGKTTIFLFQETKYLHDTIDPVFDKSDDILEQSYSSVKDKESYADYVRLVIEENRKLSSNCKSSDTIAALRASRLFRRGMTGDQESRIDLLDIDEISIFHPCYWHGMKITMPKLSKNDEKAFGDLKEVVLQYDSITKKTQFKDFLNEWYTILNRKLQQIGYGKLDLTSVVDSRQIDESDSK